KVENHDKKPSFSGDTVTIKAGETITLTDSNDVLSSYKAGENFETGGLIIDRANNRLTLTATNSSDDNVKLEYQKYRDEFVREELPSLVYDAPGSQSMGEFYLSDPVKFELNVEVIKHGSLKIIKKGNDTDKNLAGAIFE